MQGFLFDKINRSIIKHIFKNKLNVILIQIIKEAFSYLYLLQKLDITILILDSRSISSEYKFVYKKSVSTSLAVVKIKQTHTHLNSREFLAKTEVLNHIIYQVHHEF